MIRESEFDLHCFLTLGVDEFAGAVRVLCFDCSSDTPFADLTADLPGRLPTDCDPCRNSTQSLERGASPAPATRRGADSAPRTQASKRGETSC